jgi:hypothetical protein
VSFKVTDDVPRVTAVTLGVVMMVGLAGLLLGRGVHLLFVQFYTKGNCTEKLWGKWQKSRKIMSSFFA